MRMTLASVQRRLLILCCLILSVASLAHAQNDSGNIIGKVLDNSGAALPGVTVTLTGVAAPQTFITTSDGDFRFLKLSPGRYTVAAELQGFSTVKQELEVTVGKNDEIKLALTPAVSQSITVTAATPVIDTRSTGDGTLVDNNELTKIPTARDPWVVLQSIPSVLVDRVNVGGNESGQQSYFVSKGVERNQTEWNIDGVPVTDMAATGTSAFYYDFDSFDQMQISTSSSDPSVRTPGVHLNMVTKRGTNAWKGSARYFWTDKQYQSAATIPAEATGYLSPGGNSIDHINDYGLELGGPILRDKLWIWGAYSKNNIDNFSAGSAVLEKTDLGNLNGKLDAQLLPSNTASIFYMYSNKEVAGRGLGPTRPLETATNQTGPGHILKFEDTHMFSENLYLTGSYADIKNGYTLTPIGGRNVDTWFSSDDGVDANGWHNSYSFFTQTVPQKNATLEGSAYVKTGHVNNELKFGFGYRDTPVKSETAWPGSGNFGNFYDGYALAALTRPAVPNFGSHYLDTFVGDTIALGNLTFTGGVRYDIQKAKNFGSQVPANPIFPDLLPAVQFAGDTRTLEWKGLEPRLTAAWSFGKQNTSLVRASYNRYMDQLGSSDAGSSNPFYRVQYLYYYWNDLNGDKVVQPNEVDFADGLYSFANIDPNNPAAGYSPGRLDYNMKPPTTDELALGFEHQLGSNFVLGVNYTYRYRANLLWDQFEKTRGAGDFYTSDDYELVSTATGTLPNGNAYSVPVYGLKDGVDVPIYYVTTNRPDYHQTYQGLELTASKRMSNRWMMRGNVTLSDWRQHVGAGGIVNPTPIVAGDSCTVCNNAQVGSNGGLDGYINSRWSTSINGVYELPYAFSFGGAFVGREGYIEPYYRRVNPHDGTGNQNVMVSSSFGSDRLPDLFQLDLRLAKDFPITHGMAFNVSLDLFNATNRRTVLYRDNRMYTADGTDISENNWIQDLQSPRIWRLGARMRF